MLLLSCLFMSDSVQPHIWQPTGLPHPWDSPGKNTGVGCHFLLQSPQRLSEGYVRVNSIKDSPISRACGLNQHTLSCPGLYNDLLIISSRAGLGEGDGAPLQYSCLENPMDRGA